MKAPPAKRLPPLLLMLLGGIASWAALLWLGQGSWFRYFGAWLLLEVIPAALVIAGFRRARRKESRPMRWGAGLLLTAYILFLFLKLMIMVVGNAHV